LREDATFKTKLAQTLKKYYSSRILERENVVLKNNNDCIKYNHSLQSSRQNDSSGPSQSYDDTRTKSVPKKMSTPRNLFVIKDMPFDGAGTKRKRVIENNSFKVSKQNRPSQSHDETRTNEIYTSTNLFAEKNIAAYDIMHC
jgi:hypothetical protein